MHNLWQKIGILAFWISFPALVIYLSRGERTRIILTSGSKLLVVKNWLGDGTWKLPGGGLHRGEEALKGLLREVYEETGIRLQPGTVRELMTREYRYHGIHYPCRYFLAELADTVPLKRQPLEIVDIAWIERSKLSTTNASPEITDVLKLIK